MNTIRRTEAPEVTPVTLAQVKAHCRIDGDDDDEYLSSLIGAAVSYLDADGILGRAMVTQSWAQWAGNFPGWVRLQIGPFMALTAIDYYDTAGILQSAALADFETRLAGDYVICKPKPGNVWPICEARADAIRISYTAGFGGPSDVPAGIRHALLLIIGHWYENREAATDLPMKELPLAVDALIGAARVSWYG